MHEDGVPRLPENLAVWDRAGRIALGLALLIVGISAVFAEPVSTVVRLSSIVPLAMGAFGWCPFYALFGASTAPGGNGRGRRSTQELATSGAE